MTKGAYVEDRVIELLADRALGTLSPEDARELNELLARFPQLQTDVLDVAAASVDLAWSKRPFEPLPQHLADKVQARAASEMQKTIVDPPNVVSLQRPASKQAPARPTKLWWAGWVAAAACLLLAAGVWRTTHPLPVPIANDRARLMSAAGTVQAVFAATKDPAATQATGDVVWSEAEQGGYMRFRGLAQNDRAAWQYQLWIFDKEQDEKYPIDGGVFDVGAGGDVLVRITAKIKVSKATAFVVTIEKPGGVVVSKRERVVMAAKI